VRAGGGPFGLTPPSRPDWLRPPTRQGIQDTDSCGVEEAARVTRWSALEARHRAAGEGAGSRVAGGRRASGAAMSPWSICRTLVVRYPALRETARSVLRTPLPRLRVACQHLRMSAPLLAWSDRPVDLLRVASCMCTEAVPTLFSHHGPRSSHVLGFADA
jgi:hypothetical protein